MSKTFTQSQWGTVCGVSMPISGCGPCSLASIVYNSDTTITPKKTATWLHDQGYFSSAGTTRSGMTDAIRHMDLIQYIINRNIKVVQFGTKLWIKLKMQLVIGGLFFLL